MMEEHAAEWVALERIKPWAKNPRINKDAIKSVADSIKRFGFGAPIVARLADGEIIAGHTRYAAAKQLGLTRVPVRFLDLDPADAHLLAMADNKLGEIAEWNDRELADLLSGYSLEDAGLAGWDSDALEELGSSLLGDGPEPEEPPDIANERIDELLRKWGVQHGQVWTLGRHRLLCGDSTKREDVERAMGGERAMVMVTDPPYGVNLDQSWRDKALGDKAMGPGNRNVVQNDDRADWSDAWKLFSGDVAYVWHAGKFSDVVMASLRGAGFEICQQLIWNKSVMVMGRSDYHFKHEPCWYAVRNGKGHGWVGDRTQTTVIEAKSPNHIMSGSDEEKTSHPTQKPVECMSYLLKNHAGDVYDPFLGSGTTLIAAEQLGRKCYAIELSPGYVAVALERMSLMGVDVKLA